MKSKKLQSKAGFVVVGLLLVGLAIYFLFLQAPSNNFNEAYIAKKENGYLLIVKGERLLMAHDLKAFLQDRTYVDSAVFVLPRSNGIINGQEIPVKEGYYNLLGTIKINKDKASIELYYDNFDANKKDALSWNGEYQLKWVK